MRAILITVGCVAWSALAAHADVCGRNDVYGSYGFQLSGTTTIGAFGAQPQAAMGRLEFGDDGNVSGVSSVNLNGYFLGNPVTGTYTFKTDCTLSFQLQDDSGAYQHFQGLARPGGKSVEIHQTDQGAGGRGVLERTPEKCSAASLKGAYALALSGTASQFDSAQPTGAAYVLSGTLTADGAGNLTFATDSGNTTGSYTLDSDCVAELQIGLDSGSTLKLRMVLVLEGKLLLGVESDPAHVATAQLTGKP